MNKVRGLFFFLMYATQMAFAQHSAMVYENKVFKNHIKTVQCYNSDQEQSLPVIRLNTEEQLFFSFDDLQASTRQYRYEVEHCKASWQSSGLSAFDFVNTFAGDQLQDYISSSGTLQQYRHYALTLPNEQVKFKIAGNYILKIYDEEHPDAPLITQRFFVNSNLVHIDAQVTMSSLVAQRTTHQKVDFTVSTDRLPLLQASRELKTIVLQNADPSTASAQASPSAIQQGKVQYRDPLSHIFEGGNEFRRLDLRSAPGGRMQVIDLSRNKQSYFSQSDENGRFFIRNLNGKPAETENDYFLVDFSLATPPQQDSAAVYLHGALNQYQQDSLFQLSYHPTTQKYQGTVLLKQGIYDYRYAGPYEGTYFETKNSYQIFIYYRKPGSRWEALVGYLNIQTDTLPARQ